MSANSMTDRGFVLSFGHGQLPTTTRWLLVNVAKLDHEHPPPRAVLGDLEEIDNAHEARSPGKLRRDIGERDLEDLRHENLAGRKRVSAANLHVWSLPETNGRGDLASPNAIAERPHELHGVGPNATRCGETRYPESPTIA